VTARFFGVGARRFFRVFTPGATLQTRIRIVDSYGDVFSDPGATPGASTTLGQLIQSVGAPFPAPPTPRGLLFIEARRTRLRRSPRLHHFRQQGRRSCPRSPARPRFLHGVECGFPCCPPTIRWPHRAPAGCNSRRRQRLRPIPPRGVSRTVSDTRRLRVALDRPRRSAAAFPAPPTAPPQPRRTAAVARAPTSISRGSC